MDDGDLFPTGTYDHCSKEYKKAMDELVAAESELLCRYQSAQIELISINNRQEFVNGFRIGARMIIDIINTNK